MKGVGIKISPFLKAILYLSPADSTEGFASIPV